VTSGWKECQLGDVLTLQRGFDLPRRKRREGDVPIVSSSGITGYHDEAKVKAPGVITGRYGTLGEVFYLTDDFWPLNTTLFVRDFKGNDPHFISYFLRTLNLESQNVASSVPGLNRNYLHLLTVQIPPLPTQRKIAAVLSAYDDLIENNTRRIAVLEEMARMLYQEWFVRFRFPGHEDVAMVDSELGPVPEGWEVTRVSEVAEVFRGRSYRSADLVEEGSLPFLNLKCVDRDGGFRHEGLKRYAGRYKETQGARPGDIIVAVTDMTQERRIVARAARVPDIGEEPFVFSMDLVKIVPKEGIPSDYLYGMLLFSRFPDEVKQYASGVNVLHLRPTSIEEFEFALPPGELRREYALLVSTAYKQCDVLHKKNDILRRTRDLLLPRLVSGEVDVSELEIDVE
jgi:type I restriction enzyme S subunit